MVKTLLDLVEIRTKLASMLPMFIGIFYALTLNYSFSRSTFLWLLISVLAIDMATTALNNYFDYKRALLKSGYHYEHHNPIAAGHISAVNAKRLIASLIAIGIISGLILAYQTHLLILLLGMLSFVAAVSYSFGPLPISRTPLGEFLSGIFMGLLIPVIAGSAFMPLDDLFTITLNGKLLDIQLNLSIIVGFFFLGLPLMCLIGNIMLANNTCDIEEDIQNKRYTLPVLLGREKAISLFKILFYVAYLSVTMGAIFSFLPIYSLVPIISIVKTRPLMNAFVKQPDKHTTFVNAVKIFFLFSVMYLVGIILAFLLQII